MTDPPLPLYEWQKPNPEGQTSGIQRIPPFLLPYRGLT